MATDSEELVKVAARETFRAAQLKDAGNVAFKAGEMRRAHRLYSLAVCLAPALPGLHQLLPALAQLRVALLGNRAAASLALGWHVPAVLDASTAIVEAQAAALAGKAAVDPAAPDCPLTKPDIPALNRLLVKAHVRRARAYGALGFAARAAADYRACAGKGRPPTPPVAAPQPLATEPVAVAVGETGILLQLPLPYNSCSY